MLGRFHAFASLVPFFLATATAFADDRPAPVPEEDRAEWGPRIQAALALQADLSELPLPQLDADQLKDLLKGKVVRTSAKWTLPGAENEDGEEEPHERRRVMAFCLFPQPREVVWISAMDPHYLGNDRLTEGRLSGDDLRGTWYQHMDLPWPVKSRQWVIEVSKSTDVSERSDNAVWEQKWTLLPDGERRALEAAAGGRVEGIDVDDVKDARYLDENIGSWSVFALDECLTMIGYQVTVAMGGWIPDRLAARFAKNALEDLMKNVDKNTQRMPTHYVEGHEIILDGSGREIPFYPATEPTD